MSARGERVARECETFDQIHDSKVLTAPPKFHRVIGPSQFCGSDARPLQLALAALCSMAEAELSPSVVAEKQELGKAPPMIPGDAEGDRKYLEKHGVEAALQVALARIVREKPAQPLKLIAQIISPETYTEPEQSAKPESPDK